MKGFEPITMEVLQSMQRVAQAQHYEGVEVRFPLLRTPDWSIEAMERKGEPLAFVSLAPIRIIDPYINGGKPTWKHVYRGEVIL